MKVIVAVQICLCLVSVARAQFDQGPFTQCFNPNNNAGLCVPMSECESVMSMVYRQQLSQADREFIRGSECLSGYGLMRHVCCTSDTGFVRRTKLSSSKTPAQPVSMSTFWGAQSVDNFFPVSDFVIKEQPAFVRFSDPDLGPELRQSSDASRLPKPPACGGVTIENKIYGGTDADLREFPWMVLLEYERRSLRKGKRIALSCSGSLINQRYVVTAAHCVRGAIERSIGPLVSVRLGEHDTSLKLDCNGFGTCNDAVTRVGYEEIIPHELYSDSSKNKQYDIALIRLDRNVHFTDSISPVCLPSALKSRSIGGLDNEPGTKLTSAGWGQTLSSTNSPVKQKVVVPLMDQQQCQRKFVETGVTIMESQICAGGEYAEDSCTGDSGGPLMHFRGGVWVLEGIISFGRRCGLRGWPGVHTRVSSYEDWIRSKLRS